MMTALMRGLLLVPGMAALAPAEQQSAPQSAAGSYALTRISRTRLPVFEPRQSGVGGISVRSGTMHLGTDDRFEAKVVLFRVGSGQRIVDTLVATGTWAVRGDSLRIDYVWQRGASAPVSDRIIAGVTDSTVSLPRLGFLTPWWFGARPGQSRWLRFQRAAPGRRSLRRRRPR